MEFSLPAWLGGLAGTIVAVAIYTPAIGVIERRLRPEEIAHRQDEGLRELGEKNRTSGLI